MTINVRLFYSECMLQKKGLHGSLILMSRGVKSVCKENSLVHLIPVLCRTYNLTYSCVRLSSLKFLTVQRDFYTYIYIYLPFTFPDPLFSLKMNLIKLK